MSDSTYRADFRDWSRDQVFETVFKLTRRKHRTLELTKDLFEACQDKYASVELERISQRRDTPIPQIVHPQSERVKQSDKILDEIHERVEISAGHDYRRGRWLEIFAQRVISSKTAQEQRLARDMLRSRLRGRTPSSPNLQRILKLCHTLLTVHPDKPRARIGAVEWLEVVRYWKKREFLWTLVKGTVVHDEKGNFYPRMDSLIEKIRRKRGSREDHAKLLKIVQELHTYTAGGILTDWNGKPLTVLQLYHGLLNPHQAEDDTVRKYQFKSRKSSLKRLSV